MASLVINLKYSCSFFKDWKIQRADFIRECRKHKETFDLTETMLDELLMAYGEKKTVGYKVLARGRTEMKQDRRKLAKGI